MTVEEASGPNEVYPDNWQAVVTFCAMGTQWRVGAGGAIGLDYGVLPSVMRMTGVPRSDWADIFDSIRVMEEEALAAMRTKQ